MPPSAFPGRVPGGVPRAKWIHACARPSSGTRSTLVCAAWPLLASSRDPPRHAADAPDQRHRAGYGPGDQPRARGGVPAAVSPTCVLSWPSAPRPVPAPHSVLSPRAARGEEGRTRRSVHPGKKNAAKRNEKTSMKTLLRAPKKSFCTNHSQRTGQLSEIRPTDQRSKAC